MRWWPRRFVDDERSNIGNVLIKMGAASAEDIQKARAVQKTTHSNLHLGQVLLELKIITQDILDEALVIQRDFRNGKAADAMLRIVEKRTTFQQDRLKHTVSSLS